MEALGGPHTPAVGWAAGIERLAMMIGAVPRDTPRAVIVPIGERAEAAGQSLVAELRRGGVTADMAYRGNMKKRLGRANDAGAAFAVIIGDDELDRGQAQVKNLASGEQRFVALDAVAEAVRA
jgi:histidyl-tRNA synthetase